MSYASPNDNGRSGSEYGFGANVYWKFADRWSLSVGYPSESIAYQLNKNLTLYGGLMGQGGRFNVDFIPGNPSARNVQLNYREIDMRFGVKLKVTEHFYINLAISAPVYQKFRY